MSKLYANKIVSPPSNKARSSSPNKINVSPSKRRPFVSTTKSSASFGEPPPLPPRPISPERKGELASSDPSSINNNFLSTTHIPIEPDSLSAASVQLLQKQSFRWLNLSSTYWALVVMEAQRNVDKDGLQNFFDVMDWRAHGKITEQEFAALYSEWMGKSSASSKRKHTVGVFAVRQLLLERRCVESDLDLLIGMIIHEANKSLLNSPITYQIPTNNRTLSTTNLEVCNKRWISLSEELFFSLDTPGYGLLRFDEFFFLAACLTVGLQGWTNESEVEADFSIGSLTAIALQLMKDAGATIAITSSKKELIAVGVGGSSRGLLALQQDRADVVDSGSITVTVDTSLDNKETTGNIFANSNANVNIVPAVTEFKSSSRGLGNKASLPNYGKFSVTLPMFKLLLLKKGITESVLSALVVHIQSCIERLSRITASESSLNCSFKSMESSSNIGSPRLWQQAVLTASGFNVNEDQTRYSTPPLLLFLLSDGEKLLSGSFRASESTTAANTLTSYYVGKQGIPNDNDNNLWRNGRLNSSDELHETALQLRNAFKNWGYGKSLKQSPSPYSSSGGLEELKRDPVYQLILSSLVEFKILQHQLCAAYFDLVMAYYGLGAAANAVSVVCARLMPNPEAMIVELGLDEQRQQSTSSILSPSSSYPINPVENEVGEMNLNSSNNNNNNNRMAGFASSPAVPISPFLRAQKLATDVSTSPNENQNNIPRSSNTTFGNLVLEESTGKLRKDDKSPSKGFASSYDATKPRNQSTNWKLVFDARKESLPPALLVTPAAENSTSGNNIKASAHSTNKSPPNAASKRTIDANAAKEVKLSSSAALEALLLERLLAATDPTAQLEIIEQLRLVKLGSAALNSTLTTSTGIPTTTDTQGKGISVIEKTGIIKEKRPESIRRSAENEQKQIDPHPGIDKKTEMNANIAKSSSSSSSSPPGKQHRSSMVTEQDSPAPSESSSGFTVSTSIAEMLEEGQSAGKYAQTLRQILRKMSRDDSKVQLKSLEQILAVGHSIIRSTGSGYRGGGREQAPKLTATAERSSSQPRASRRDIHESSENEDYDESQLNRNRGRTRAIDNDEYAKPKYRSRSMDGGDTGNASARKDRRIGGSPVKTRSGPSAATMDRFEDTTPVHSQSLARRHNVDDYAPATSNRPSRATNSSPIKSNNHSNKRPIVERSKPRIPGLRPNSPSGKGPRKAFGHPV